MQLANRIAYYMRKLNQYSRARYDQLMRRPTRTLPANRLERLLRYKDGINRRIEEESAHAVAI